jgi:DNA-directed RNA polymerase, mitochondrial
MVKGRDAVNVRAIAPALTIAKDPVGHFSEWSVVEEPTIFLAGCFEWQNYRLNGLNAISRLINFRDATSSGLQLFSAILRDYEGARLTNLTDSPLQDIYSGVLEESVGLLWDRYHNNELSDSAKRGVEYIKEHNPEIFTNRKLSKRGVMTMVYASRFITQYSEVDDLFAEWGVKEPLGVDFNETVKAFSHAIWDSIGTKVTGARTGMDWLISEATKVVKREKKELPVIKEGLLTSDKREQWTLPSLTWTNLDGFPVVNTFYKRYTETLDSYDNSRNRHSVAFKRSLRGAADLSKYKNSISANYIHSLDSTLLGMIVEKSEVDLSVIHDCVGGHCSDMQQVDVAIREAFFDLVMSQPLQRLQSEFGKYHDNPEEVAEPPMVGTWNPEEIRNSSYCFH